MDPKANTENRDNIVELKIGQAVIYEDIKYIRKVLEGNGKVGLVKEVTENSTFRIQQETKGRLMKLAIGSGWAITILILVLSHFGVV